MIRIAICDDERVIREQIRGLIVKKVPYCHIESFASGDELLAAERHFDLIFLDIQMKGLNGIETAKAIRTRDRRVVLIFVTAIKEYVFEAFDVAAFYYLLKPIEGDKFGKVFDDALEEVQLRSAQEASSLFVRTKSRSLILKQNEIIYIESRAKKVGIHTVTDVIEAYGSMKELEGQLENYFYRCHRGYLVNMAHIAEYSSDTIEMSNGEQVYLTKEKYPEFVKMYMRYLRNGGTVGV